MTTFSNTSGLDRALALLALGRPAHPPVPVPESYERTRDADRWRGRDLAKAKIVAQFAGMSAVKEGRGPEACPWEPGDPLRAEWFEGQRIARAVAARGEQSGETTVPWWRRGSMG